MAIDRNKVIAAAQKYIQKGAYKKAIKEYSKIVREHPDDVRILLKVGDLQARDGQSESAAMTYNDVADHYVAHGFFLKAVAAYKLLLGVEPENFEAKLRLADLYFQLGLLRDALQNYQAVGAIFSERGWTDRYLGILDRIVEIDPEHAGNRIQLGEELARFNRNAEAAEHFLIAASKLKAQGRFDEYTKVMERYVHLQPKDKPRILDLSRIYLDQGRAKRALVRLQDVFRDNPRDTETVDLLVRALAALGENVRAVRVLEDLAREYNEHGANEARDTLYRRILEIDPEHAEANRTLGGAAVMSFELVGDGAPAPAANPGEIQKLLDETDVYLKYNLYEKALEHLNQVFAIDPENLEALERRKTSLIATGQEDTAIGVLIGMARIAHRTDQVQGMLYLNQALAIRPNHPDVAAVMAELGGADMVPEGIHANVAELVEPTPAPAPVAVAPSGEFAPPPIAEDVFDAFDMEDTAAGHEVLDEEFRDEIADEEPLDDTDGQSFVALEADEILPADLDEGLDEVDRMEVAGAYDDARAHLFELLGQWPEHAEMLLRRMDALPSTEPESPSASQLPAASPESALGLFVDAEDDDHEAYDEGVAFSVEPADSVEFVADDPADSVEFVADPADSVEFIADPADSVEFIADDPADSVEFVADAADSIEFVADASESGGFDDEADSDVGIFTIDDEPQPTGSAEAVHEMELFDVDADMVAEESSESYAHFAVAEEDAFESGAAGSVDVAADDDADAVDAFADGEPDALLDREIVFVDPSQSASTGTPVVEVTAPAVEEPAPVLDEEPLEFIDDEDDFPDASGAGPVVPVEPSAEPDTAGGHDPFAALESLLASGEGPVTPTSKSGEVPRLSGSGASSRLETSGQRMSVPEVARGTKRTVPPLPGFPSSGAAPVVDAEVPPRTEVSSDEVDPSSPVAALLSDSGPNIASREVAAIAVAESDIDDDLEIGDVEIAIDADAFDDAPDTDADLEPLEDVDDLEPLEDIADMDIDADADALEPLETVDGSLENGADARAMEAAQAAAARAADVDAPVGRASSLVAATFSPADAVLESAPDSPLADAIRQRRDGNGMAAMFTLQEAEAGPNGVPASFELALANIEMGLFFEGISTLEQLLGQPDIQREDRLLVHYFLGIAYEAMDQVSLADVNFRVVAESTPELYPDVFIRLDRIATGDA